MDSFAAIIRAFGISQFSEALGIKDSHARTMLARDSVPSEYWEGLVAAAKQRGIEGVSLDLLARLAASRRRPAGAAA